MTGVTLTAGVVTTLGGITDTVAVVTFGVETGNGKTDLGSTSFELVGRTF